MQLKIQCVFFTFFIQDFWNLIDFVTFVMAIVTVVMYAMKKVFGAVAMNTLHETGSGILPLSSTTGHIMYSPTI